MHDFSWAFLIGLYMKEVSAGGAFAKRPPQVFSAVALNAFAMEGEGWLAAEQGLRSVASGGRAYMDVLRRLGESPSSTNLLHSTEL